MFVDVHLYLSEIVNQLYILGFRDLTFFYFGERRVQSIFRPKYFISLYNNFFFVIALYLFFGL